MKSILFILSTSYLASCAPVPPPHPAVLAVKREEAILPPHLKSPALHNPHLRQILPLTSLLHEGEMPVIQRESDEVSRQEIYNILSHAGLSPRRPKQYQPDPFHQSHQRKKPAHYHASNHNNHHSHHHQLNELQPPSQFFSNPELLQHL